MVTDSRVKQHVDAPYHTTPDIRTSVVQYYIFHKQSQSLMGINSTGPV